MIRSAILSASQHDQRMANLLKLALFVALSAVCLPAQVVSKSVDALPAVEYPSGYLAEQWVPVVVLWSAGDQGGGAKMSVKLVEAGFAVVKLSEPPDVKRLGSLMTSVRQRVRIASGGVYAVIASDHELAIKALLGQRHEFQAALLVGDSAGDDLKSLRRLPKRKVKSLATMDPMQICDQLAVWHSQRQQVGPARAVHQVLDSFHDAAAVGDEDRYFKILPDDSIFLGTDATERWTGKQFRSFAMPYFKRASAWTYVPLDRFVTLSADGKIAWFDEALDNLGYGECRGTGVLERRAGSWVIRQYNLTVPVPNDLMSMVAGKIRVHLDGEAKQGK